MNEYIINVNNRFNGKVKEILLNHIKLFYDDSKNIMKNKYEIGEEVKKAAESETDPAKGAKDSTTSTTKIPQTGTNEVIITLVVAVT